MVLGWLGTLAADTISHVAGESPVVFAEKEFDRFMKSYEFAIEAQKLKREDVRDLVELIVSRMDMYHLVGALLLEFCIAFYGEFKLLEEEYMEEPCFILEIFLLSNICAIGYLLFAVWLSLHASVAAHAIGVEFLLDSSRLTIPSPENLKSMRQSTSLFRNIYHMFTDAAQPGGAQRVGQRYRAGSVSASAATLPGLPEESAALDIIRPHTETSHIQGQGLALKAGPGKLPLALDNALDTMEHRHNFAQSHRCWLRFDAYSRVCMALGINQMLQALSYFIVGPVQRKRPSAALISLCAVQAIALLLLKLDLRNTEADPNRNPQADPDDTDDSDDSNASKSFLNVGSKDVSVASYRDLLLTLSTFTLAPLWTTLALWANRFTMHVTLLSVSVTPCFFLHAMWLFLVLKTITPNQGDLLPQRLRTVGYLDIFTKDIQDDRLNTAASAASAGGGRRRGGSGSDEDSPESMRPLRTYSTWKPGGAKHASHSAEKVPWEVVNRFTITVIWMWLVGGIVHFVHTLWPNLEEYEEDIEEEHKEMELEMEGHARRLTAAWLEPASFFEVTALHCNSSHVSFSSPWALHSAQRLADDVELGPLVESHGLAAHSVMCRESGSCDALVAYPGGLNFEGSSSWQLESMGYSYSDGDFNQPIEVPQAWRMATGAWLPCGDPRCDAALLAGWDGTRIVVADLRRGLSGGDWTIEPRFAVRPGSGELSCRASGGGELAGADGAACNESEPGDYGDVQAMQLSVQGACQTLTVLRKGMLDGWDLHGGRKIGSWRVNSTLQTTMCHDGRHLLLAHPGDEAGPVVEAMPLPAALANCPSSRRARVELANEAEAGVELANESVAELGRPERFLNM